VATVIVIAVGFRPDATVLDWLGMFALVAFYIFAITYLFAAIGLAASSPEAANGYGFILMFLPYVSSAFVPVDTMPAWLQWIALILVAAVTWATLLFRAKAGRR
jgi:ABC-2 type transport system permease protein